MKKYQNFLKKITVDKTNKIVFTTIKNLLDKNILVSPITLKNYLPDDNEKKIKLII